MAIPPDDDSRFLSKISLLQKIKEDFSRLGLESLRIPEENITIATDEGNIILRGKVTGGGDIKLVFDEKRDLIHETITSASGIVSTREITNEDELPDWLSSFASQKIRDMLDKQVAMRARMDALRSVTGRPASEPSSRDTKHSASGDIVDKARKLRAELGESGEQDLASRGASRFSHAHRLSRLRALQDRLNPKEEGSGLGRVRVGEGGIAPASIHTPESMEARGQKLGGQVGDERSSRLSRLRDRLSKAKGGDGLGTDTVPVGPSVSSRTPSVKKVGWDSIKKNVITDISQSIQQARKGASAPDSKISAVSCVLNKEDEREFLSGISTIDYDDESDSITIKGKSKDRGEVEGHHQYEINIYHDPDKDELVHDLYSTNPTDAELILVLDMQRKQAINVQDPKFILEGVQDVSAETLVRCIQISNVMGLSPVLDDSAKSIIISELEKSGNSDIEGTLKRIMGSQGPYGKNAELKALDITPELSKKPRVDSHSSRNR